MKKTVNEARSTLDFSQNISPRYFPTQLADYSTFSFIFCSSLKQTNSPFAWYQNHCNWCIITGNIREKLAVRRGHFGLHWSSLPCPWPVRVISGQQLCPIRTIYFPFDWSIYEIKKFKPSAGYGHILKLLLSVVAPPPTVIGSNLHFFLLRFACNQALGKETGYQTFCFVYVNFYISVILDQIRGPCTRPGPALWVLARVKISEGTCSSKFKIKLHRKVSLILGERLFSSALLRKVLI